MSLDKPKSVKVEDKTIFGTSLGKLFVTILAIFSVLITVFSFTYDKGWFYFLEQFKFIILIDGVLLLFLLVWVIIRFFGEEQPEYIVKTLELTSVYVIALILTFLFFSFILQLLLFNNLEPKIGIILLFALLQLVFGVTIIVLHFFCWLGYMSIIFYRAKKPQDHYHKIRIWGKRLTKLLVITLIAIHMSLTLVFFILHLESEQLSIYIDNIFFWESIILAIMSPLILIVLRKEKKKK